MNATEPATLMAFVLLGEAVRGAAQVARVDGNEHYSEPLSSMSYACKMDPLPRVNNEVPGSVYPGDFVIARDSRFRVYKIAIGIPSERFNEFDEMMRLAADTPDAVLERIMLSIADAINSIREKR